MIKLLNGAGTFPSYLMEKYYSAHCSLFTTCNNRCGYCTLAESGSVMDMRQLVPYRDLNFIHRLTDFFNSRTTAEQKWHLLLTGGEPLLMPNFEIFCDRIFEQGNKISLLTNMTFPKDNPKIKFLLNADPSNFKFILASFHPEAEAKEDGWFETIGALKSHGLPIIVRYVCPPQRLEKIDYFFEKTRQLDITFNALTVLSASYPQNYTEEERAKLAKYQTSFPQHIFLEGGLDTTGVLCKSGHSGIAADFLSGSITPCILTSPVLGNIHENRLELWDSPRICPSQGIKCTNDIHFYDELIVGLDKLDIAVDFEKQRTGFVPPLSMEETEQKKAKFKALGFEFSKSPFSMSVQEESKLIFDRSFVRNKLTEWNKKYYPDSIDEVSPS